MAQLLVWLITLADNVKNKRLGEYLVWMMLRCSLTLSLPENLLFAELPAQICFTPLTRKKTIFHVRRKISWGWHIPHLMTKAGTTWSNYIQIMLCFPYTMFLIWAALDRGADVLKVNPSKQDHKDIEGLLLLNFKSHNNTMSANCSFQILQKLHTTIKKKISG